MKQHARPYKGGLRFHPTVCASIIKFLRVRTGLQKLITALPMGGWQGGADFDPKGNPTLRSVRFLSIYD